MATNEEIGKLCANVTALYDKPNINARTMLSMPEYWAGIARALKGEEVALAAEPEQPSLTSVEPNNAEVGGDDLTVTLRGTAFTPDSVIVFDGKDVATTMKSAGELNTIVEPSLYEAGIVTVKVKTIDHETSALSFTFAEPNNLEEEAPANRRRGKR